MYNSITIEVSLHTKRLMFRSLTKKVLHAFSILFSTSFVKETVFNSFSPMQPLLIVVLNDIIKVARFHITESRGIKFELRKGVI